LSQVAHKSNRERPKEANPNTRAAGAPARAASTRTASIIAFR
jgi:hypothetical protein